MASSFRRLKPRLIWRSFARPLITPLPFGGIRWLFWLWIGIAFVAFVSAMFPGPDYLLVATLAALPAACAFEAWTVTASNAPPVSETPDPGALRNRDKAVLRRTFLLLFAMVGRALLFAFLFVFVISSLATDQFEGYPPRAKVTEAVLAASVIKNEITQRAQEGKPLASVGTGLAVKPGGRVAGGEVTENGSIYVVMDDPPAVVSLKILSVDSATGKLTWICSGYPVNIMPAACRN